MVDTACSMKSTDRLLISSGIFQGKRKYFVCNLKCTYCIFTLWDRIDHLLYVILNQESSKVKESSLYVI